MSGTLKDGYYNAASEPDGPCCWRVHGPDLYFVYEGGREELETEKDREPRIKDIRSGELVPSLWLPPGVTHNPAMGEKTVEDGFYSCSQEDAATYGPYEIRQGRVLSRHHDEGTKGPRTCGASESEQVLNDIRSGKYVPVIWPLPADEKYAFFETVEEAEASLEAEPPPESLDDHEAASRFINLAAMDAVSYIALECSWRADDQVRRVFTTPSQLDRAIAARVVELLS